MNGRMRTTAEAVTPSARQFSPSGPDTPRSQPHCRMADTERCWMRSPKRTWSGTSKVLLETPWRTSGSAHPGDPPAGAAGNAGRRGTWKAYAEESLEERTWRSRGAAAWTSRRRSSWQL